MSVSDLLAAASADPTLSSEPNPNLLGEPTAPVVGNPGRDKLHELLTGADEEKQREVAATADAKRLALGGLPDATTFQRAAISRATGAGIQSANPTQHDLSTLSYAEIRAKYGEAGNEMVANLLQAEQSYAGLRSGERSPSEMVGDTGTDVLSGGLQGVAGLAAIGGTAFDAAYNRSLGRLTNTHSDLGLTFSDTSDAIAEAANNSESATIRNRAKADAMMSGLQDQDSEVQRDQDIDNGTNHYVADAYKIGRDALTSGANLVSNPQLLTKSVAEGAGSIAALSGIGEGIGALGGKLLPMSAKAGMNGPWNKASDRILAAVGPKLPEVGAGASLFGGGAYVSAANKVMHMDQEDLDQLPAYQKLLDQGLSKDAARKELADATGQYAGALGAVAGMGAGAVTKKLIKNPLEVNSLSDIGKTLTQSTVEQTAQGGATTAANNAAMKLSGANPNQDLTEGVGQAIGSGAVTGGVLGGVMAAPGAHVLAAGAVKDAVVNKLNTRTNQTKAENAKVSDVSDEALAKSGQETQTQAQAPETKAAFDDAVTQAKAADVPTGSGEATTNHGSNMEAIASKLMSLNNFDPKEVEDDKTLPDTLKTKLQGVTTRVELMHKLADVVNQEGPLSKDGRAAGLHLLKQDQEYQSLKNSDMSAFEAIPEGHAADKLNNKFGEVYGKIGESPKIQEALGKIASMSDEEFAKLTTPVTDESVKANPVQAQKDAENIATVVAAHPDRVDPGVIKTLLEQVDKKNVKLTPEQEAAVKTAQPIAEAAKSVNEAQKASGRSTKVDEVTKDVMTHEAKPEKNGRGGTNPQRSAAAYAKQISDYMHAVVPDLVRARAAMDSLHDFLESMKSKSENQNQHYLDGEGAPKRGYDARNPESGKSYRVEGEGRSVGVTATSKESVDFVQTVHAETQHISDTYNRLSEQFPELKSGKTEVKPLHENLQGDPNEVAKAHTENPDLQAKYQTAAEKTEAQRLAKLREARTKQVEALSDEDFEKKYAEYTAAIKAKPEADHTPGDKVNLEVLEAEKKRRAEKPPEDTQDPAETAELAKIEKSIPDLTYSELTAHLNDFDARFGVGEDHTMSNERVNTYNKLIDAQERIEDAFDKRMNDEVMPNIKDLTKVHTDVLTSIIDEARELAKNFDLSPENKDVLNKLREELIARKNADDEQVAADVAHEDKLNKIANPTTIEESQPDLYGSKPEDGKGKLTNMFHVAFKLAKDKAGEFASRILTSMDPWKTVFDAMTEESAFIALTKGVLGKGALPEPVKRAWSSYLRNDISQLRTKMENALRERLNTPNLTAKEVEDWNKANPTKTPKKVSAYPGMTPADMLKAGMDLNRSPELKLLNLVELQPDGSFKFNKRLLDQAVIAAAQWALISDRFTSPVDAGRVNAMTDIPLDRAENFVDQLNYGMSDKDMLFSLAEMIKDYWGVNVDKDAPKNYPDGIAQSMAAEILAAMLKSGLLQRDSHMFNDVEHGVPLSAKESAKPVRFKKVNGKDVQVARAVRSADRYVITLEHMLYNERTGEETVNPLFWHPTLLEETVLTNPNHKNFYEGDKVPVATHQMHSDMVENSDEDMKEIKAHNSVPYTLDTFTHKVFDFLGEYGMLDVFAAGDLSGRKLNLEHKKRLVGQNNTERSGWEAISSRVAELQKIATETAGVSIGDIVMHFAHNKTVVGRVQQLGGITPQGHKGMRETHSAYRSVVDLSTGSTGPVSDQMLANANFWTRAIAQGLGIGVNKKMSQTEIEDKLHALVNPVNGTMRGTIKMLEQIHSDNPPNVNSFVQQIHADFAAAGIKLNARHVALKVLSEQARWNIATEAERAKFETHVYLEADGVANGMTMAMHLFQTGDFTKEQIDNMKRGGWFPQGAERDPNIPISMNESGLNDLYTEGGSNLQKEMTADANGYAKGSLARTAMDHVGQLLSNLLPKSFDYDPDNGILADRDAIKNPFTITLYGAGAEGIAGKLTTLLAKALYEKISDALEHRFAGMSMQEAMFGKGPTAESDAKKFIDNINALLTHSALRDKSDIYVNENDPKTVKLLSLKGFANSEFKLDNEQFASISSHINSFVVNPLQKSIENTMGKPLMDSMKTVQKAAQVQSMFMAKTFMQRVQEAIAAKIGTEGYKKGDYLSQNELDAIKDKLLEEFPVIDSGHQRFLPVKSQQNEDKTVTGSSLSGDFKSGLQVNGPAEGGVISQPMLNMGYGDARLIQLVMNFFKSKPLSTFDGTHYGLSDILKGARDSNQAAFMAQREGNPTRGVHNSFKVFLKNLQADPSLLDLLNDEAFRKEVAKSIELRGKNPSKEQILTKLAELEGQLGTNADSVDARGHAFNAVKSNNDQMAGPGVPYEHPGRVLPGSSEEQAKAMNDLKAAAPSGPVTERPTPRAPRARENNGAPEQPKNAVLKALLGASAAVANKAEDFVRTTLETITSKLEMSNDQRSVWDAILKAGELIPGIGGKGGLKDYNLVVGTREAIEAYQRDANLPRFPEGKATPLGYADPRNKHLYLIDPNMETLLHEAIHASTLQTVMAHYMGGDLGPRAKEIKGSIARLETFMGQFRSNEFRDSLGFDKPDAKTLQDRIDTWEAAVGAIEEHLNAAEREGLPLDDVAERKALALNEFMAWSLANKDLSRGMRETIAQESKNQSVLGRMSRAVWKEVKNIVFGPKGEKMPELGYDMFSHVLFNTQVLMHEQPNTAEMLRTTTAQHSRAFGDDPRLTEQDNNWQRILSRFVKPNGVEDNDRMKQDATQRLQAGLLYHMTRAQGLGFTMTEQARGTFERIVTALSLNMHLDPNALAAVSELYTHVIDKLEAKDLEDPLDPVLSNRKLVAENKLDVLLGANLKMDTQGRSSLLGVFMGLALVDDGFRAALRKISLPEGHTNTEGTLDAMMGNFGHGLLESLADKCSGQGKSENVRDAIDLLTAQVAKTADDAQSTFEQLMMAPNLAGNRANDVATGWLAGVSEKAISKSQEVQDNPNVSKATRQAASVVKNLAMLATEKNADIVGESILKMINQGSSFRDLRELAAIIVGRTGTNGKLFDLLKIADAMVSKVRQQFRDDLPATVRKAFDVAPTKEQFSHMYHMAKTDLASLIGTHTAEEVLKMLDDPNSRASEIKKREDYLRTQDPRNFKLVQEKTMQLAGWMMGEGRGSHLLKNANAVADLVGMKGVTSRREGQGPAYRKAVDELASLYALNKLSPETQESLSSLVQNQGKGMNFVVHYLKGQRETEVQKAQGEAYYNAAKGYVPRLRVQGADMIVAFDKEGPELLAKSYVRMGDYNGSQAEGRSQKMGYYYAPVQGRAAFSQGMMQNATHTSGGVETSTGRSVLPNAGHITSRALVARIAAGSMREGTTTENLQPVFNRQGKIIAYERTIDPSKLESTNEAAHLGQALGVWRGRQVEEEMGQQFNKGLIHAINDMWNKAVLDNRTSEFVDLLDPKSYADPKTGIPDPVIADAMRLATPETKQQINEIVGDKFMVRRDMVEDVIGARKATVGDAWTGNSRWSPETLDAVKNLAIAVYGNKAYSKLVNAESMVHEGMQEAKNTILIRSIIVPMTEFVSNMLQLVRRGVAPMTMVKQIPRKIAEAEGYEKGSREIREAQAYLRVAENSGDVLAQRRLNMKIQAIEDRFKRYSIWPLIEAGELGTISETGVPHDETAKSGGQLHDMVDGWVSQLPLAVQKAGRYAVITKDTALYQGLQKTVEYGDFLAKAVQYDHLTQKKGYSKEAALAKISEEYVHYGRTMGRTQSYLNDMGLMWFMNFKLKTAKVALSMMRENPVQCLLGAMVPMPEITGVGTPLGDNFVSKLLNGSFWHSVGPQMALRAPMMNPWVEGLGLLSGHL